MSGAMYVHVTDGLADAGPCPLPANWRNVSGLDGLSDAELAPLGWYPCPGGRPDHDPAWQMIAGPVAVADGEGWRAEWTVTARDLAAVQAERLAAVRAEAGARILAIAPAYRQANLTARAVVLTNTYGPRYAWGEDAPAEIVAEWAAGYALWQRIDAIRVASNAAEAAIQAAETPEAAASVTPTWPE